MAMTGFDIAVLLVVGLGAIFGFMRGLVQEILSLATWVTATIAIRLFYDPVFNEMRLHVANQPLAAVLSFILLLLMPLVIGRMIARKLGSAARESVLGLLDQLLGFGFGAIRGGWIVVLGFSVLMLASDTIRGAAGRPEWVTQASTYPPINFASETLVYIISERRKEATEAVSSRLSGSAKWADETKMRKSLIGGQ